MAEYEAPGLYRISVNGVPLAFLVKLPSDRWKLCDRSGKELSGCTFASWMEAEDFWCSVDQMRAKR